MSDGRYVMGTALEVQLVVRDDALGRARLREIFDRVEELDRLLSHYSPDSDVSRLNAAAGQGRLRVDARTHRVLGLALQYGALTEGAFDVTIGPLVELWKQANESGEAPLYERVAEVRARVGADRLHRYDDGSVELSGQGMRVDLGGIAKGFALDEVLPLLRSQGVEGALASFGRSSAWAVGAPPDADGWRLAVRAPTGELAATLTLRDQALSISSTFGDWSAEGARPLFGHVVDPRTGWPRTRPVQSAVVAPSATLAEVLSTALTVLDHESGIGIATSEVDAEAIVVDEAGRLAVTPGFYEVSRFEEVEGFRSLSPGTRSN